MSTFTGLANPWHTITLCCLSLWAGHLSCVLGWKSLESQKERFQPNTWPAFKAFTFVIAIPVKELKTHSLKVKKSRLWGPGEAGASGLPEQSLPMGGEVMCVHFKGRGRLRGGGRSYLQGNLKAFPATLPSQHQIKWFLARTAVYRGQFGHLLLQTVAQNHADSFSSILEGSPRTQT